MSRYWSERQRAWLTPGALRDEAIERSEAAAGLGPESPVEGAASPSAPLLPSPVRPGAAVVVLFRTSWLPRRGTRRDLIGVFTERDNARRYADDHPLTLGTYEYQGATLDTVPARLTT